MPGTVFVLFVICLGSFLAACGGAKNGDAPKKEKLEDLEAKRMLQGIWVDENEGAPSFWAKGDSLFFADTTSIPAHFSIIADTLVIEGATNVKYPIVKQSEHVFEFVNQGGENVHLVKGDSTTNAVFFSDAKPVVLNQLQTIKRDTVIFASDERYHVYVQVNPTRQKVFKQTINNDGVVVENVYYDNSIRFIIFHGANRVYQHDFHRDDFKKLVPEGFFMSSVLSDLVYYSHDATTVSYVAQLAIPDSFSSYEVLLTFNLKGALSRMSLVQGSEP